MPVGADVRVRERGAGRTLVGWSLLNLLQALFTAAWSAFWITAALLTLILTFGRRAPLAMARLCWGPGILAGAGARLEVVGAENVDRSRPSVFVSNHASMIDVPVVFAALPVNVRFVLKRELLRVPFIGWYALAMGMIFVDRQARAKALGALTTAAAAVREGASVVAFPEGTRSRDGQIRPFKVGAFHLAAAAGVPIIPMAIAGSARVVPSDGFRVRPGIIRVAIGAPIEAGGLERADFDDLMRRAEAEVRSLHALLLARESA